MKLPLTSIASCLAGLSKQVLGVLHKVTDSVPFSSSFVRKQVGRAGVQKDKRQRRRGCEELLARKGCLYMK